MLDEAKGQIAEANLFFIGVSGNVLSEGIDHQSGYPFVALRFDGRRSIGK
jgi:hypothetical protein